MLIIEIAAGILLALFIWRTWPILLLGLIAIIAFVYIRNTLAPAKPVEITTAGPGLKGDFEHHGMIDDANILDDPGAPPTPPTQHKHFATTKWKHQSDGTWKEFVLLPNDPTQTWQECQRIDDDHWRVLYHGEWYRYEYVSDDHEEGWRRYYWDTKSSAWEPSLLIEED
jgi:hypothetical protein